MYGKNVTLWVRGTVTHGGRSETKDVRFVITGHPSTSYEWTTEGSETITTGNQLEFNDIFGTATIFKRTANSITFDALERTNDHTLSFDNSYGSTESVSSFMAVPIGENQLKYGHWLVEENFSGSNDAHNNLLESGTLQFVFRPNSAAINNLINTDETVISTLNFKIREGNSTSRIIQTNSIILTIDRRSLKPILSISSKTSSTIEGYDATFIITSNGDPKQPVNVSYTPIDTKGNFLDSKTSPNGISQTKTLTFSQAEGSDDWTDEININLRDADGIDSEDGSITVTLDSTFENSFYLAAAEPNNSITIKVKDAEKPTLSFLESLISVTEEDVDKNVRLTLNLSEAIDNPVDVFYTNC